MRIAIDISPIIYGTGVSKYRENLVKNLLKIDSENEYLLYGGSFRRLGELKTKANNLKITAKATIKTFPLPPRLADIVWNKFHFLAIEKLIGKCDIVHTSDWAEPPSALPKITTIHDLAPLVLPRLTPRLIVEAHRERLKWVKRESKTIICPSQATKNDLIKFGFDEDKISVIYEAPNMSKAPPDRIEKVKKEYSIREEYILMIGTNPRKNLQRAIEAFQLAKAGKNLKLIIAGENKDIRIKDERGVRFLGYVPESDLPPLLTGSKLLLYPSLYEGFGIPILESFICEVPVVTSNISSMPEAAGGAAVLVDPYDIVSIAEGIKEALNKPKTLIARGLTRVKSFSWQKCARETLEIYKKQVHQK